MQTSFDNCNTGTKYAITSPQTRDLGAGSQTNIQISNMNGIQEPLTLLWDRGQRGQDFCNCKMLPASEKSAPYNHVPLLILQN